MTETTSIDANGFTFTVDLSGPSGAPTAIALHGYPQSRHSWGGLLDVLEAEGVRAIAPDQRGYSVGARPPDIGSYHVDHLVADVLAIADAVGAQRFHLIGHDWGGQVAWLTAARHPGRLHSLSVLSRPHPAAFAHALETDPAQAARSRHHKAFQDPDMAARLLANDAEKVRNTLCYEHAAGLFGKEGDAGAPRKRRMSDEMAGLHLSVLGSPAAMNAALNWYRAAFAGGSTLARADVPSVSVPTLYLWGDEDMSVGEIAARTTPRFVSAPCRFETIEGGGHFLAEEMPHRVAELVLAHIANSSVDETPMP